MPENNIIEEDFICCYCKHGEKTNEQHPCCYCKKNYNYFKGRRLKEVSQKED